VLLLAGLALRAVLGSGRGERGPSERAGSATGGAPERADLASPDPDAHELSDTASESRAELRPDAAETPAATGWWGRVLDGDTEEPLPEASFAVALSQHDEPALFTRVERDGLFVAPIATWNQEVVSVRAPGYGTAFVVASGMHRSRSDPQRVLLWRAATLVLRVTGVDAPLATVSAPDHEFLQAEGATFVTWDAFTWPGEARGVGTVVFADLPARARLSVEIVSQQEVRTRRTLALEPGERLELSWPVGGELVLAGHALESGGRPLPELELWILAGDLPRRNLTPEDERLAFAVTRTDGSGAFAFAGLAPGRYLVGPAPRGTYFVPLATAFALPGPGDAVALTCWPGVELRGRVRSADGSPVAKATVTASATGLFFSGSVKEDGTFRLGPLAPGPYELVARAAGLDSAPLAAQGGDAGLELVLPAPDGAPR
jgi:carboxypeptidase family protein